MSTNRIALHAPLAKKPAYRGDLETATLWLRAGNMIVLVRATDSLAAFVNTTLPKWEIGRDVFVQGELVNDDDRWIVAATALSLDESQEWRTNG